MNEPNQPSSSSTASSASSGEYLEDEPLFLLYAERDLTEVEREIFRRALKEMQAMPIEQLDLKLLKNFKKHWFEREHCKELTRTRRSEVVKTAFYGMLAREIILRKKIPLPRAEELAQFSFYRSDTLSIYCPRENERYLLGFLRGMHVLLSLGLRGHNNKRLFLTVCALLEGSGQSYATGGAPSKSTRRREIIFETLTGQEPVSRQRPPHSHSQMHSQSPSEVHSSANSVAENDCAGADAQGEQAKKKIDRDTLAGTHMDREHDSSSSCSSSLRKDTHTDTHTDTHAQHNHDDESDNESCRLVFAPLGSVHSLSHTLPHTLSRTHTHAQSERPLSVGEMIEAARVKEEKERLSRKRRERRALFALSSRRALAQTTSSLNSTTQHATAESMSVDLSHTAHASTERTHANTHIDGSLAEKSTNADFPLLASTEDSLAHTNTASASLTDSLPGGASFQKPSTLTGIAALLYAATNTAALTFDPAPLFPREIESETHTQTHTDGEQTMNTSTAAGLHAPLSLLESSPLFPALHLFNWGSNSNSNNSDHNDNMTARAKVEDLIGKTAKKTRKRVREKAEA